MNTAKHQFALFWHKSSTKDFKDGQLFNVHEIDLVRRIRKILRLKPGQTFILFDRRKHVLVELKSLSSMFAECIVLKSGYNATYKPLTVALPLLKKNALEEAVAMVAALSCLKCIVLIACEKSRQKLSPKEYDRLSKIILATAEQSKNFRYPLLKQPVFFKDVVTTISTEEKALVCSADTHTTLIEHMQSIVDTDVILFVGPEADFTKQEYVQLAEAQVEQAWLSPSTLRTQEALFLSAGTIEQFLMSSA